MQIIDTDLDIIIPETFLEEGSVGTEIKARSLMSCNLVT